MTKQEATRNFDQADAAWALELKRTFGIKDAADARYEKRGRGEPGTKLHTAYKAREEARLAYEVAWRS